MFCFPISMKFICGAYVNAASVLRVHAAYYSSFFLLSCLSFLSYPTNLGYIGPFTVIWCLCLRFIIFLLQALTFNLSLPQACSSTSGSPARFNVNNPILCKQNLYRLPCSIFFMLVISFCRKAKQILSTQVHRNLILSGEIKEEHKKQAVKHGAGRWGMSEVSCRQNWSACRVTKHLKCVCRGCVCVAVRRQLPFPVLPCLSYRMLCISKIQGGSLT